MYLSPLDSVFFSESAELWKKREKKKKKKKKNGEAYSAKKERKIASESTETVSFMPKRFFRNIMMSFWFSAKESDSRYDSLRLGIQSSLEHNHVCLWNTTTDTNSYMQTGATIHNVSSVCMGRKV